MRQFWFLLLPIVLAVAVAQVPPAWAQQDRPAFELDVKTAPAPPTPAITPPPGVVEKDADEAIAIMQNRQRAEKTAREAAQGFERPPNLNRDVTQGIQMLNIQDAIRRR